MPGSRNSKCKGAEWEHVGSERETSRRQCGWRRENERERRKRASQRQSLVDHSGSHRHCPSPAPSFLICKMGIKNTLGTSLAVEQLSPPGYRFDPWLGR